MQPMVLLALGAGALLFAVAKSKPKSKTSEQVRGASGTDWLITYEPLGGPVKDLKLGTVSTGAAGQVIPVLQFQQVGTDVSTRTLSKVIVPDPALLGACVQDLKIRTA